ncbi:hypothetical protein OOT46_13715 [Aquabacterium sp. A7-Y]|uniref:hypothetical protein n=1 Tax=Aquabacterium sp. A7-Y TaxID=1349605 RepID=UPI00223E759C|nr:hypothetical protein [Aquabacterium sp. A7-Y]MCW7538898.1 hypothetical protein [Aquabacterium sp. A7-Y]
MRTALALNPNALTASERYPEQLLDLQAWVTGQSHRGLVARQRPPRDSGDARVPQLWVLGSSDHGARHDLPYAFAYFFNDGRGVEQALSLYRSLYQPSARHPQPQATVCVWAPAADTEAEARHHALSYDRWRINPLRGTPGHCCRSTGSPPKASTRPSCPVSRRPGATPSSARPGRWRTACAHWPRACS